MVDDRPLGGTRLAVATLTLAVLYVLTGRLGLELAHVQTNATLIWPPTGISLAMLVLYGRRLWPGVFIGALVVNVLVGTPWIGAAGIALGNTLEALLGAFLLERVARFDFRFARVRDVLWFSALGVLACTWVSPTIGLASLWATGEVPGTNIGSVWWVWWLGDVGGAALFAPLAFVLVRGSPSWRALVKNAEAWAVLVLVVLSSGLAFGPWDLPKWVEQLLGWSPLAVLIWAGLRLGPRGAVTASAVTGTIAVIGTGLYGGLFAGGPIEESLLRLWAYGFTLAAATAILAALVAERDRAAIAQREAEEKQRAIELQMERAQRLESLGVLASGVAHDFNNLLTAIRVRAELLTNEVDASQRPALLEIESASARAAGLCRQLLDYAGGTTSQPERIRLEDIAGEVVGLLRGSIAKKIAIDVSGDVPDVLADALQMRQVLMNLVMNAAEAIGEREGKVSVRFGVRDVDRDYLAGTYLASDAPAGRYAALEVEDDGAGMDAATLERSFEPFFTTKEHGRGLGLAAITGIVRAHGGAVKVVSKKGKGTTFTVLLPIAPAQSVAAGPPSVRPMPSTPGTVLVADDEESVLAMTRTVLERAGWKVHTAADGTEAIAVFDAKRDEIDVVLLDIDMPGLDGWEALDAMRATKPDLPAVFVSGLDPMRELPEPALFVAKPYQMKTLIEATTRVRERAGDYG